jgi:hypothetical protein
MFGVFVIFVIDLFLHQGAMIPCFGHTTVAAVIGAQDFFSETWFSCCLPDSL